MTADAQSCLGCEGRCCTTYIVPLTGYDVWRIVEAQRLLPAVFVQREPEGYPTDTGFQLRPRGPTYGLSLQHQSARRNERPCVFLLQLREGVQRCGIYAHRPRACQTYPMQWQQRTVVARNDLLCPRGSWAGLSSHQAPWRELLQRQDDEWWQYAAVVQAWNRALNQQPAESGFVLEQYLDFLVNAYDYLAARDDMVQDQHSQAAIERDLAALADAYVLDRQPSE